MNLMLKPIRFMKTLILSLALMPLIAAVSSPAADKTLIDYFLPTPITGALTTNTWGARESFPAIPRTAWKTRA